VLKVVEIERDGFVNFSQNILRKLNFLGSIWGQLGQKKGQLISIDLQNLLQIP
jgi:hypothetical protein